MVRALLVLLFTQFAVTACAATRVTVDQLSRIVASSRGKSDAKAAARLWGLDLTERLSEARLALFEAALPGPDSRRALVVLADQSVFLPPPSTEIPRQPPPDLPRQRDIAAKAIEYVSATLHRLPNLFAIRDTIHFEDQPPGLDVGSKGGRFLPAQPLHPVSRSTVTILSRQGQDFVQTTQGELTATAPDTPGLSTFGEFGTIFSILFGDLTHGTLEWSRWEQAPAGLAAVFRFTVPAASSHYQVKFCCNRGRLFQQFAAYHGEITIDPAEGTILRLTLLADLNKTDPIVKADLMVEYGPVTLGGKTYFCPRRSIALSLARPSKSTPPLHYELGEPDSPLQSMLNEVVFTRYHLFHADTRILAENPDMAAAPGKAVPAAPPAQAPAESITVTNLGPALSTSIPVPAAVAENSAPAPPPAISGPPEAAPPSPPEIALVPLPAEFQQDAPLPVRSDFALHLSSRVVEMDVIARDRKGRPIRDLNREDFVVYDNGIPQPLRSFSPPGAVSNDAAPPGAPTLYVNRRSSIGALPSAAQVPPQGAMVVLFDVGSLPFADFTRVREQLFEFFERLPASEPVGLYLRTGQGFHVLAEPGTSHSSLTAALLQWKPDAVVMAGMQEDVSGRDADPAAAPPPIQAGPDSTRQALTALAAVAMHLAAIPGHKNVVWIAGDRILADWTGQDSRTGAVAALAARIQEAISDAHVSLFPLDASPLQTAPFDIGLQNDSAQTGATARDMAPGTALGDTSRRSTGTIRRDLPPVQIAIRQIAQATGGHVFERSNNLAAPLKSVIEEGEAAYLLGFAPADPPDGAYHRLTVEVAGRRGIRLRYRSGYLYSQEPTTLQDRFRKAVWQSQDETGIALTARTLPASQGAAVNLGIAASDVALTQRNGRWTGKLDIFLVMRDDTGMHAQVKEQTLALNLKPETYEKAMREGILFDQYLGDAGNTGTVRIIVVDEDSGRMGSVTLPASFAAAAPVP
jgi:VWFA-related protein